MENNNPDKKKEEEKQKDDSTSFMPSKPLNDSAADANESGTVNDVNPSSPSQENIDSSTPLSSSSTTLPSSTLPSSDTSSTFPSMTTSSLMENEMPYSEQSDLPNLSLPGSSGQQETLTSTGDLVSGECYRYLGNVKNIDGQYAPIFSGDCSIQGGRSRKRRRRRRNGGATEKKMLDGGRRRYRSKRVNKSQYRKRRSYRGGLPSFTSPLMAYNMPV